MMDRRRWVSTGPTLTIASMLVIGGLLLSAGPAAAATSIMENNGGSVARPALTLAQALIILAAMMVTLTTWIALVLGTKPHILRRLEIRRFLAAARSRPGEPCLASAAARRAALHMTL